MSELQRKAVADEHGEVRFGDVPPGHYVVVVRALGFQSFTTTIDIAAGKTLNGELTLLPFVARLDGARTTANAPQRVPAALQEFESRAHAWITGYFLTDSMLRYRDKDNLRKGIRRAVRETDSANRMSIHGPSLMV